MILFLFLFLNTALEYVVGDSYLHNPRGSNNKLSENNNNVDNANRLFDSQNNNAAGYQVCDKCCDDPNVPHLCDAGVAAGNVNDNNHQFDANVRGSMFMLIFIFLCDFIFFNIEGLKSHC